MEKLFGEAERLKRQKRQRKGGSRWADTKGDRGEGENRK